MASFRGTPFIWTYLSKLAQQPDGKLGMRIHLPKSSKGRKEWLLKRKSKVEYTESDPLGPVGPSIRIILSLYKKRLLLFKS